MKRLRKLLAEFSDHRPSFGESGLPQQSAPRAKKAEDVHRLRADVQAISDRDKIYFNVGFAALLLLFLGLCWIVWHSDRDSAQLKAFLAFCVATFLGIINRMLAFWKEKVISDVTVVLVSSLEADDIRPVAEAILRRIK